MKIFYRAASVFIIFFLLFGTIPLGGESSATFDNDPSYRIVCNDDYEYEVGMAIDEAATSIHIAMYLVVIGNTVETLIDKLVTAQDRGVEIKIILDNDNDDEDNPGEEDYAETYLKDRGLTVKLDTAPKMLHSKLLIIDNRTVIIGSTNWSDNSIENNNEANARIDDQKVAAYYERYFQAAWKDASEDFDLGTENYNGVTPLIDRDYFPGLMSAIEGATERIYVLHYAFKLSGYDDSLSDKMFDAMVNASGRGVDVRVCLEYSNWEDYINEMNQYTINRFVSNGVDAYFDDEWQITHTKLIVIDDSTILGSTNWAYSGLNYHHNADVLIRNADFTRDMVDFYREYWLDEDEILVGDISIYRQFSSDDVTSGGILRASGYVNIDSMRFPDATLVFWVEDTSGAVVIDSQELRTDAEGKYDISLKMPVKGGRYVVWLSVSHEGTETMESKEITVTGNDADANVWNGGKLLTILIISAVSALIVLVLLLMVLKK
ncbi:MAG: phospholipase D-like domain-containing protein [Candidatus Thermoplasmatota archaeon]|jgi:HKD family nuclease|nr:phospholipase D-like domain-containing protein [Candidatus Thermoplasmatota archaeon]MDP7265078.1 phospholipase D-like domain-containing protein [Candidatus Thermoplasmatota archaeon]